MPIDVNLPDGRVIVFPDDTTQEVIERTAKRAIENPYSLRTTKELEAVSAAPSTFRDVGESLLGGTAGGIKTLTDLFGAGNVASKKLEEVQRESFQRMTPERQRELAIEEELSRRAQEEGLLAEAKQAGRSFLRSPLQQGVSALGSSLPVIAATAAAPEATIPAMLAGRAGLGAAAARTAIANAPGIAVGAGMGVGGQKGQDYERVKQAMLERGATEEEAEAAAQRAAGYSLENLPRQAAAGVAGGAEAALGVESLIGRAGRARAGVRGGPEAPTWGGAITQSTLGEAIPEAAQNVVGAVGSNVALQQAGIDTDLFKGAAGEAVSGALAAALMGAAVSPLQMRQLRQEFARDQLEKQMEEQKKAFEALQKQQAQVAKTKEELGTPTALALPAPAPKVEEQDPLQNPLGNLTKTELGPEVVGYIEQYRSANGMPLLNSYSIEDVKDAMTQVNPAGEAAALDSLVAAKSGYKPDVNYSAQDVLNSATNKVDTETQGFRDFLRRTTGSEDLNTMSQPQLYAAVKALENVPVGQGLTILPEGSNASRFTDIQMVQGLDAIASELEKTPALTPEQAITKVKEVTGLTNDRDAATLIKQLVKDNNLDSNADGNLVAPTEIKNLPEGYSLEKGTFKQSDQQLYGVLSDGKPLEGVDTYTNPQDAQAKVDALNKTREKQSEVVQQQIQKIQDQIDRSQQELDAMEAAGEGGTDAYKQAKAQHEATVSKVTDNIHNLQARQMMFQTPLTMGPVGMKQVNRTGFTLFKDGIPVSTHPSTDAALDSLVGTLPEADVAALAQEKDPGMRTLARKARQRLEQKEKPVAPKKAEEKKPEGAKPEGAEEAKTLAEQLAPILKKFGLGDVQLQILNGMEDEGSYAANLIKIALDAKDAIGVLRHESIHALKDLGFFSPQQWAALERMAKEKWINQYLKGVPHDANRSRYDAYVDEYKGKVSEAELESLIIEEAIADAFRAFGSKPPPGMLASIINKIKQFFERLNNALHSAGYMTAEDVFGKIEKGELKPEFGAAEGDTKKPSLVNAWKATPAEVKQADAYEEKNGILPYVSEGRLDLPTEIEKKSIKTADKYGLYEFDPVLNIPLNKDGTVTVYYHTTKEEAKKINASKTIPAEGKSRIYLTNESNGAPILKNRGNFDQTLDGSTVLLNIDPSILQVDDSYDNGRIDFFVPMAQGDYFNRKMRMASIQKGRQEAIVPTFSYKEHEDRIAAAIAEYNGLDSKEKKARLKQARSILKTEHNVGTLLTENGKLEKTRLGDFEIEGYDGKSIASMGLGMASAQQISDKVSTCPRSAICEGLCLGETSGGNFLYGGAAAEDIGDIQKSAFRAAARMFQYLKTEALIVHPEEFAIALQAEIDSLKRWSNKNDYDPAVRLNVTSDFKPSMFAGLINANPDVMFYDYTKLNGDPIADNHHLTYSSTGFGQVVNGEPVFFKNKAGQYDHNWAAVRDRLDNGYGVAMAFSSKSALPKFLRDEETGKTYQVWDGDLYDARFLDPKAEDGVTGQIVGLRNKAATLKEKNAAAETGGFFIDYDPKRDGDTVVVPDQSQFKGKKVVPIAKKSLRAQEQETIDDGLARQDLYDQFSPSLKEKLQKHIDADRAAEGIMVGRFEGKEEQRLKAAAGRARSAYTKAFDAEFPGSDISADSVSTFIQREGRFWNFDQLTGEKKSLRAPDTKEFNDWFDESKVVNKEGEPMVMYHGTARDISEFKPKTANAIFVSPDPDVGSIYSADSFDWLSKNAKDELTEEQQAKAKADALAAVEEDFSYLRDPAERKQPDYKKLVAKRDAILKDIEKNSFSNKRLSEEALPYLATAVKDYLPTGPNIMPLFVRALRPFDYENKKHLDMVIDYLEHNYTFPGEVSERVKEEAKKMGMPTEFSGNKLAALKSHLARGLYQKIESEPVQRAIRALQFDSFYVKEHGAKNLGVYSPVQLKSATGNIGGYSPTDPDIRKSLRPKLTTQEQAAINEKVGKRDEKSWLKSLMDSFDPVAIRQATMNRYEQIGRREKLAAKQAGLDRYTADVSAEAAALMSDYAAQMTQSAFGVHDGIGGIPRYHNGTTLIWNDNGKIKGPIAIFEPLAQFKDPEVFRDWQFWMSAKRGARLELDGREKLFTQADLAHAKTIEAKYPAGLFESVRKDWDTYNRGLVEYMIQTGVINRKMGESWMKHGDYFPFYRQQMDEDAKGPRVFSAISGVKPPKKLKGGTDVVGDFFENVVRNTQAAIESGMKNIAAERAIRNELDLNYAVESVGPKGEPKRPTSMTNVVTVLRDGETHYYECEDKLFVEAMKGLNMAEIPGLHILAAPANLLRSFVTKTPDFILANLLRDSMSAWVTSGAKITPIIDTAKGFTQVLANKDPDIQALYNAGLIGGYEFTGKVKETGKGFQKQLKKTVKEKTGKEKALATANSVWEALEKGSSASDAATRLAVYKEVMDATGNQAEALFRAMEIMNFQRKGNSALIRILTAVTPFLNARIQGLDVLYRAGIRPFLAKDKTAYEQAIAKNFIKRGVSIMALTAMYYAMVHDDDDYLAQEEETRDNNWIIPSLGVKIPIPFEVGIIFKVMPERMIAYLMGNDTGEQVLKSAYRNLTSTFGIQIAQAVLPPLEVATGHSFFTGRPITPAGLEDVSKEFRVAPSTSKLAEVLGQFTSFSTATGASIGLSPIEIDHLIKGYTGTLGTYFVDAADVLIGLNSDIPKPSKRFEQMPFIRRFALDPEARGTVTAYYELKNAVDEAVRTSNLLERTGKVEDFVRYQEENMPLLASKDYVNALYKSMKEFNQMKQQIRASGMDADDKRDALLAVEQAEAALVSQIKEYRKMIAQ